MSSAEKIKRLFTKSDVTVNSKVDDRIISDALTALKESGETKSFSAETNIWSMIMKSRIAKLTAAAVIIIGLIIGVHKFGDSVTGTSVAFGKVLQNIQNLSYTFDLGVVTEEGASDMVKSTVLEPGRVRMDLSTGLGKISSIVDMTKGKSLILFHKQKTVMIETPGTDRYREAAGILALSMKPIENLWNLQDGEEKKLGKKDIDGQSAEGFKIFQEDQYFKYEITMWANAKTGIPILVEMVLTALEDSSQSMSFTMSNFDLDGELDEDLFSLEVPAGYTLAYQLGLDELEGQTKSTKEAEKVEKVITLWSDGKESEAVKTLLEVDWTKQITFSKQSYFFSLTEKDYIALGKQDQQRVIKEVMRTASQIRRIVKEVLSQGQTALSAQDYEKSEKYFDAGLQLGKLLASRPDRMLIIRLVGIAAQKVALNEMVSLYTATNHKEKLQVVEKELQALEVEQKKIREGLTDPQENK